MAFLYITEFNAIGGGANFNFPSALQSGVIIDQQIGISGSASLSAAFNATTRLVRLHTDAICSIKFGSNPTAATTNARLALGSTEYFVVVPGQKVSVISNT